MAIWSSRFLMACTRFLSRGTGSDVLSFPRPIMTSCMNWSSKPYFWGVMKDESKSSGLPSSDCLLSLTAILPSTVAASSRSSFRRAPLWTDASFSDTMAASWGMSLLSMILPLFSSQRKTPNHLVISMVRGSHPGELLDLVGGQVVHIPDQELQLCLEFQLLHPVVGLLEVAALGESTVPGHEHRLG